MAIEKMFFLIMTLIIFQAENLMPVLKLSRKRTGNKKVNNQFSNATILRTSQYMLLQLPNRNVKLLNVPDVMQTTGYSCGPSSASAALYYFQITDCREACIIDLAGSNQKGTGPKNLTNAINSLNAEAVLKQGMTIKQLQKSIDQKKPVIVLLQAWADKGIDYLIDYKDGHYVVLIGYDQKYLYFQDPWITGSITYLSKIQFLTRWHDQISSQKRNVTRLGIIVSAPVKSPQVIIKFD